MTRVDQLDQICHPTQITILSILTNEKQLIARKIENAVINLELK